MFPLTFSITIEPMLNECLLNPQRKWFQGKMNRLIRYKGWAALEMEFAQNQNNCKMQTFFWNIVEYEHLIETRLSQLK